MIFDTHAHLDDQRFDEDRKEVIQRAYDNGIKYIVNIGYDLPSSIRSVGLSKDYSFIYAAVGVHPHDVKDADQETLDKIKELTKNDKVVAIGEIGLDYYYDNSPREAQRDFFCRQINLAKEVDLPIVIHNRDAFEDVYQILKNEGLGPQGGVMHCYSGSWEMAVQYLDLGMYISLAGPVTFKNAKKLLDVAKKAPLERLLVETDCPYLAPHPYRGKRNESSYVSLVVDKIAQLRGLSYQEVAEKTTRNAFKLFNI